MNKQLALIAAIVLLVAGLFGYYELPTYMGQDVSIWLRVAVFFGAMVGAVLLAALSGFDALLAAGVAILIFGVVGYYEMPKFMGQDVSVLLRIAFLLSVTLVALGVSAISQPGASLIEFSKGSRTELRKMVWPSRQETIQTTMIVLVLVVIVAIFLWLVDMAVFEIIYDWLLGVDD